MTRSIYCFVDTDRDCCFQGRFVVNDLPNELGDITVACSEFFDKVAVDSLLEEAIVPCWSTFDCVVDHALDG